MKLENMKITHPGKLSIVSDRFFQKHKKLVLTFAGLGTIAAIGSVSALVGCGINNNVPSPVATETPKFKKTPEPTPTSEPTPEVELPEYLLFDANDNEALIERSAKFIANSRACGIDFSSDKDISKYMDFYFVVNSEYIDPIDYARLNYNSKTTQSIIDNYQYCMNEIDKDLYTVTPDTMLEYDFIADKASQEVLMQFQEMIAKYNVAENKNEKQELVKEMESFLYNNFINKETRGEYTYITYEMIGRMTITADSRITNGLSKDITEILCEDLYTCDEVAPVGEKQKSEKAQAETSLREMLDDKLETAHKYYNQDLTLVPEIEQLTGYEVEQKISDMVALLDVEFVANPELDLKQEAAQNSTTSKKATTLSNGKTVSTQELKDLGLNPSTVTPEQYEAAVRQKFEQDAVNDPNHKLENADGVVVGTGSDATYNAAQAEQGATDAFNDGYNGASFSPRSQSPSYLAGYTHDSYNKGVAAKAALNANINSGNSSSFQSTPNSQPQNVEESITQQDYTSTPSSTPVPESTPQVETETYFVPADGSVESSEEEIVEEGFKTTSVQSQLSELKAMKDALLAYTMPTVTIGNNGNTMLSYDGEEFDLSGKSMRA